MADEPRPHWDASLISAVLADLRDVYDSGYGEEQAFRIIAAVEDWQKRQVAALAAQRAFSDYVGRTGDCPCGDGDLYACPEHNREPWVAWWCAHIEQIEAAIARVREVCEVIVENAHQFYEVWDEDPTAAQVPYGQWMVARHILRALDGGAE